MDQMVQYYMNQALASSTVKTYKSGKTRYLNFCTEHNFSPLPVMEEVLRIFTATIVDQGLKHSTTRSYVSSIRHMQIMSSLGDPLIHSMARLEYVVRGIKMDQAKKDQQQSRVRLPMTPSIMRKMRLILERERTKYDNIMLWAACCMFLWLPPFG